MTRLAEVFRQAWRDVREAAAFAAHFTAAALVFAMAFLVPVSFLRWMGWRETGWRVDLAVVAFVTAIPSVLAVALLIVVWAARVARACRRRLTTRGSGPGPPA
jgi:hypothetical protein